jgi:hypothetical protein
MPCREVITLALFSGSIMCLFWGHVGLGLPIEILAETHGTKWLDIFY